MVIIKEYIMEDFLMESFYLAAEAGEIIPIVLDAALGVLLLIFAIVGAKKGFLKGITGLIGIALAVFLAFLLAGRTAAWVEEIAGVSSKLSDFYRGQWGTGDAFGLEYSEENLTAALGQMGIPAILQGIVTKVATGALAGVETTGKTVGDVVFPTLGALTTTIICGVVLFIVFAILISVLANVLTNAFKVVPIIGTLNGFLGFVLGLIKGLVVAYAIVAAASLITPLNDLISQTYVLSFLRDYNLLIAIFKQDQATINSMMEFLQQKMESAAA